MGTALLIFFLAVFPFLRFILLPLSLGVRNFRGQLLCYFGSIVVLMALSASMYQGYLYSCSINESECIGATAALYISLAWQGIFILIGPIFVLLSYVKRQKTLAAG
jgi:hypothetical protein